jgi:excisionase family DNA binding protein
MAALLIRQKEAAQLLGISRVTFYQWSKAGRLPAPIRFGPGTLPRWNRAEIEEIARKRATA